jgi:hypothetical protein
MLEALPTPLGSESTLGLAGPNGTPLIAELPVPPRLPPSPDSLLKFRSRRDGGLPRKDLLHQHPMRFLVAIRAAIAYDQQSVVRVGGIA